jgi:predicted ATPase
MKNKLKLQTNWYVITGGPGSGKTTTIELLRGKGYRTTIEHARHFIDTQMQGGKTVEEIRRNQLEFQKGVLEMQLEQEASLPRDEVVFLDRALPDALAYYRFCNLPPDDRLLAALEEVQYKKIFILECLPLINDYARREDTKEQNRIHELITEVYSALGGPLTYVPVLPPGARVSFILDNL